MMSMKDARELLIQLAEELDLPEGDRELAAGAALEVISGVHPVAIPEGVDKVHAVTLHMQGQAEALMRVSRLLAHNAEQLAKDAPIGEDESGLVGAALVLHAKVFAMAGAFLAEAAKRMADGSFEIELVKGVKA